MLKIHFLNVGHGDCTIIEFINSGRVAVIDINRSSDIDELTKTEMTNEFLEKSDFLTNRLFEAGQIQFRQLAEKLNQKIDLEDPIDYLNSLNVENVFRFISTHPHMDHITGLNALKSNFNITNAWICKNNFKQDNDKLSDEQKLDWQLYKNLRDNSNPFFERIKVIEPQENSNGDFWQQDGIFILAPNPELIKTSKLTDKRNKMSYVLLIKYKGHKIVLGGDAEEETWRYIHEHYSEQIKNVTLLKASHHGRDSGYYQPAVKLMNPEFTLVSVGKKPKTDASNKYRQYTRKKVWSTRFKGNIILQLNEDFSGSLIPQRDN